MAPTLEDLGIDKLGLDERLAVARQIWDSVTTELDSDELDEATRTELDRRLALADADPTRGVPWEQVLAEARARSKR